MLCVTAPKNRTTFSCPSSNCCSNLISLRKSSSSFCEGSSFNSFTATSMVSPLARVRRPSKTSPNWPPPSRFPKNGHNFIVYIANYNRKKNVCNFRNQLTRKKLRVKISWKKRRLFTKNSIYRIKHINSNFKQVKLHKSRDEPMTRFFCQSLISNAVLYGSDR